MLALITAAVFAVLALGAALAVLAAS